MKTKFRSALLGAALCAVLASGGCAYRSDLAQGNFIEQDAVNRLRQGMTPEQVRYILGTPMLIDPFDSTRWYYVHYLREGWSDAKIRNLILQFRGMRLAEIQGDFNTPAEFYLGMPQFRAAPEGITADVNAAGTGAAGTEVSVPGTGEQTAGTSVHNDMNAASASAAAAAAAAPATAPAPGRR